MYVEGLKAEPALADHLAWSLEALGVKALPFVRELYDYPELLPRMSALQAGAHLNDARAASFLKEVAKTGSGGVRTQAISLLGDIDAGPTVDEALRELLNERELVIRVSAYEALAKRAERVQLGRFKQYEKNNPDLVRIAPTHLEVLAKRNLPGNSIQGVERWFVSGKFFLDIVPGGEPLIYITQQGQPRIVLFGDAGTGDEIVRPMVMTAWSERLMINAEPDSVGINVYYRPLSTDRAATHVVKGGLKDLIEFFARKNTPEDPRPGLGMTYSEVVGALYALNKSGGTSSAFATERDKLQAQILAAASSRDIMDRPETAEERDLVIIMRTEALEKPIANQPEKHAAPRIVPIEPPAETKKQ